MNETNTPRIRQLETELAQAIAERDEALKVLRASKKYLSGCQCAGSDGWRAICKIIDRANALAKHGRTT